MPIMPGIEHRQIDVLEHAALAELYRDIAHHELGGH